MKQSNTVAGDFVLNNSCVFPWTVRVFVPNAKGDGKKDAAKFKVEFRHVTPEERLQLLEDFRREIDERKRLESIPDEDKSPEDVEAVRKLISFENLLLDRVIERVLSGVRDGQGTDISQDPATKGQLIANAWARDALLQAYEQALRSRSPEGN
jgi:hypothetical protein